MNWPAWLHNPTVWLAALAGAVGGVWALSEIIGEFRTEKLNPPARILFLVSDPLDAPISIERDLLSMQDALRDLEAAAVAFCRRFYQSLLTDNPLDKAFDAVFEQFAASGAEAQPLLDALPDQAEALRQASIEAIRKAIESQAPEGGQE